VCVCVYKSRVIKVHRIIVDRKYRRSFYVFYASVLLAGNGCLRNNRIVYRILGYRVRAYERYDRPLGRRGCAVRTIVPDTSSVIRRRIRTGPIQRGWIWPNARPMSENPESCTRAIGRIREIIVNNKTETPT